MERPDICWPHRETQSIFYEPLSILPWGINTPASLHLRAANPRRANQAEEHPSSRSDTREEDMASRVAALLLLGVVCVELVSAQRLLDCCKSASTKSFPAQAVQSYIIQDEGRGCDIKATVGNKKLCVSHPDDQEWVRDLINLVNNRRPRKNRSGN
ncbi:uncharacterized protein LOC142902300 [Nelusetta ayraudi]|uniref:uncharacterized protein LOC142902300 n=1 Tax=Nelusetta ayraudi TaxID=303726 RepID=UPI003F6F63D0